MKVNKQIKSRFFWWMDWEQDAYVVRRSIILNGRLIC